MSQKCALITGITGQDGSYLAELLLENGYRVYGMVRRSSSVEKTRIDHLYRDPHVTKVPLYLEYGDLADASSMRHVLTIVQPDEVYNLAAQSHVRVSFDQAEYTFDVTGSGVLRLLEAIRDYRDTANKEVRFYQASSSEMFGSSLPPQNEDTPFRPRSPYAVAKVASYWHTANYREAYHLHCSNGILFNHESERRGENFVTRKITRAAGLIKVGLQKKLFLGNLEAKRDWGHAKDYVEAMWLMLQQDAPDDYVVATGESHSVTEFLDAVFSHLGLNWQEYVTTDPYYFRPTEVDYLLGDSSKARRILNWRPKHSFRDLVRIMTEHDLELAEREAHAMQFRKSSSLILSI
ncbi:MAG: GDP-mannose 4,6-dehydratase [Acidobacteria bacterium]|nr:GDP-mannose 4,6-dehydratase [Acidobacteriota bacterium]